MSENQVKFVERNGERHDLTMESKNYKEIMAIQTAVCRKILRNIFDNNEDFLMDWLIDNSDKMRELTDQEMTTNHKSHKEIVENVYKKLYPFLEEFKKTKLN